MTSGDSHIPEEVIEAQVRAQFRDELMRRAVRDTKGQPETWAFVTWLQTETKNIMEGRDPGGK